MSGLLRRIKRSRPADAGEPHPEGQAAGPEGAATPAEPPVYGPAPPPVHGPERSPAQPVAEPPVLLADPSVPAGVDPAAAPLRPPAGRRGRLRRRLRYLRRARELMLRDLGGLLYEIHRTGGGNVEAHATIVSAKVQRIAGVDAEAHALETALAAPRAEAILFQPGIGGTCHQCGELYGSDARFCSRCGAAVADAPVVAETAPAAEEPPARPRRRIWPRRKRPPMPVSEEKPAASPDEADATAVLAPTGEAPADAEAPAAQPAAAGEAAAEQPAAAEPAAAPPAPADGPAPEQPAAEQPPATDEPAPEQRAAEQPPATDEPAPEQPVAEQPPATDGPAPEQPPADEPRNPFGGMGNGHADDRPPPGLSSGDPLVTRRTGS